MSLTSASLEGSFPDSSVGKESTCNAGDPSSISESGRSPGEGIGYPLFPCGPADDESTCNAGDLGSIPGLGKSPGERKGYPFQYSGLENSMDSIVHMVTESDLTERLSLSLPLHHLGNPHQAKRALNWSCRAGAPSYTHPSPRIRSLESKNLCFILFIYFFLSLCFRNKFSR